MSQSEDSVELLFCGLTGSINIRISSSWVASQFAPLDVCNEKT